MSVASRGHLNFCFFDPGFVALSSHWRICETKHRESEISGHAFHSSPCTDYCRPCSLISNLLDSVGVRIILRGKYPQRPTAVVLKPFGGESPGSSHNSGTSSTLRRFGNTK